MNNPMMNNNSIVAGGVNGGSSSGQIGHSNTNAGHLIRENEDLKKRVRDLEKECF